MNMVPSICESQPDSAVSSDNVPSAQLFSPQTGVSVAEEDLGIKGSKLVELQTSGHVSPRGSVAGAVTLELCCGSAGLTASLRKRGFDSIGIDHSRNKQRTKAPVIVIDLSTGAGQSLFWRILKESAVWYVHLSPPCGTSSRARDRPVPAFLTQQGAPSPPPLRSSEYPLGLPGLTGLNATRVASANALYAFCGEVADYCTQHDIWWTMENPYSSYYWEVPRILVAVLKPQVKDAQFPQCAHGGARPVWRRWTGTLPGIEGLNAVCDNNHIHTPFTVSQSLGKWEFSTAEEATYPLLLCERVSDIFLQACIAHGLSPVPSTPEEAIQEPASKRQMLRASTGLFVRGNRMPQLISEYKNVVMLPLCHEALRGAKVGSRIVLQGTPTPSAARVLRLPIQGESGSQPQVLEAAVGIYRSPQEFSDQAQSLVHPIDAVSLIPDSVKQNIFWMLTNTPAEVSSFRLNQIKKLRKLSDTFAVQDKALASVLPKPYCEVLRGKRLFLLKTILLECNYPDVAIVDEVSQGLPLTGPMPVSNVFPPKFRPALITCEQLRSASKWMGPASCAKIKSCGSAQTDEAVWQDTMDEQSKGWLSGPFHSYEQVAGQCGSSVAVSRRFGIVQGHKTRSIDDYSESQVNATVSAREKVELQTVDDTVALYKCALESIQPDGLVIITLANGSHLAGRLPRDCSPARAKKWLGKAFDLKSAYRQIPTRPEESWATVLGVYDPHRKAPAFFQQLALPFGAVGSVFGFNRLSRAIWAAGCYFLRLAWTNYYDDYPCAELECNSMVADIAVRAFFLILGWRLATETKKCLSFSNNFVMLGVVMELDECASGVIKINNKRDRIDDICQSIQQCVATKFCSPPVAAAISGKCQYASGQTYGRLTLGLIQLLRNHQYRSIGGWMDDAVFDAMSALNARLLRMQPRRLDIRGEKRPVLVFSDGAAEGEQLWNIAVGAVVFYTVTQRAVMFGGRLPSALVQHWRRDGSVQTIGQAELLPVLLTRLALPELLRHRRVFWFIDNDGARQGLIRGVSSSPASQQIIEAICDSEAVSQSWPWYGRVASESNPGDGPSRLRLIAAAENLWAEVVGMHDVPLSLFQPTVISRRVDEGSL